MKKTDARWRTIEITPAEPFAWSRLHRYDVQNMLIAGFGMPAALYQAADDAPPETGDQYWSLWNDRFPEQWRAGCRAADDPPVGALPALTVEQLRAFAAAAFEREPRAITGARIVRFDNAASGYPHYRLDAWEKHPDTPDAPAPRERRRRAEDPWHFSWHGVPLDGDDA